MPELPEVESLRLYLIGHGLVRRTIIDFSVNMLGMNSPLSSTVNSKSRILGRHVVDINRIGKNLIIVLDAGAIILHMGMTGRLAIRLPLVNQF